MVHDDVRVETDENHEAAAAREPRHGSAAARVLVFTGVAGACVLGAGLGLWARPSDIERPAAAKAAAPTAALTASPRRIPIVVDDTPAPVGKPMDVLGGSPPRPAIAPPQRNAAPQAVPELMAPTRPPAGLVKVVAPAPAGPIVSAKPRTLLPPVAPPPVAAAPRPNPAAKLLQAKADAAKAEAAKARAARLAEQKAQQRAEHRRELAERAAEAKAERLAKLKARREHAREVARETALAKAAPPPKPHGLKALLAKLAPHHEKPAPEAAKPERRKDPSTRIAKAEPKAQAVKVRCASPDPGEALACGDPSLSAAERRLARAYRDAEAAGVPAATLAQQQQRGKQARAAAAREAPWAVREVYQARIAELQDLAHEAQGN